jgi:hypothetical protein
MRSMECEYNLLEHPHKHIGDCSHSKSAYLFRGRRGRSLSRFQKMEVMENLRVLVEGVGVRGLERFGS